MLTLEEKIKLFLAGVEAGVSESAGCNDGQEERTKDLIERFFSMNDEDFKEFCEHGVVTLVAYGG